MKKLVTQLMELRRYKEELAAIGLLSLLLLTIRWVSAALWPTTGQYDLAAETETVFWTVLRVVIYSLAAWTGLRVAAPSAYNWLKHGIVDGFETLTAEQKTSLSTRMYAIMFFGLILLALGGCTPAQGLGPQRMCVVESFMDDVGVREATGRNDGPRVEAYLAHVGLGKGHPWCAAFVSYHLSACGVSNPRSAWSPAFTAHSNQVWTPRRSKRKPMAGDVFSLWYGHLGRVGHVGFVVVQDGRYITTVEGNTSGGGSRDGDGVYTMRRELSKVYVITNYIANESAVVRHTGAAAVGVRKQAQEHRDHHYGEGGDQYHAGAQGHPHPRAQRGGAARCALAHAWPCIAGAGEAQRTHCAYTEQRWVYDHSGVRVRQHGHQGQVVGSMDQGEHTARNQDQGARGEGALPMAAVVARGCDGCGDAPGRMEPLQTPTLTHG